MTEPWGPPANHQPPPTPYQPPAGYPPPTYRTPGNTVQPYVAQAPVSQQPYGVPPPAYLVVSPGGRFGANLLDLLLIMVTFGIGWLIWSAVTWSAGQSPAKQLLGYVVADARTGAPYGWGEMFMREFVIRLLLFGLINTITFSVFAFVDAFSVFRADRRMLHDLVCGSVVRHR